MVREEFRPFLDPFYMLWVNPLTVHGCVERCVMGEKYPEIAGYWCISVVKMVKR